MKKCFEDMEVKIAGIPLELCVYETIERYKNVTVEVRRCKNCGHIDIAWVRQEDTISEEGELDG